MEMAKALGMAVRQTRQRRSYSQERLGELADVDRTYISGLERGLRNPALSTLGRITAALDVRLSALFALAERNQTSKRVLR